MRYVLDLLDLMKRTPAKFGLPGDFVFPEVDLVTMWPFGPEAVDDLKDYIFVMGPAQKVVALDE